MAEKDQKQRKGVSVITEAHPSLSTNFKNKTKVLI